MRDASVKEDLHFAELLARHRSDVRDVPANTAERFDHRDDHDDEEAEMDERRDENPQTGERPADDRHMREDELQEHGRHIEEKPDAAEDDRLHGIEADELIVLLDDVKHEPADERDAGESGRDIRRQAGGSGGICAGSRSGIRRRSRGRVDWIWHASFRGTAARFVKATRAPFRFRAGKRAGTLKLS